MKLNISLNDDLVKRIDKFSSLNYLSRSGFITQACLSYLTTFESLSYLNEIKILLERISSNNSTDEEIKNSIAELDTILNLLKK